MKRNVVIILISILPFLVNCDEITIPDSDETLPEATLKITIGDEEIILTSESHDVSRRVKKDDLIFLLAIAEDKDGGVKKVCLHSSGFVECTDGHYTERFDPMLLPICHEFDMVPGDTAPTMWEIWRTVRVSEYERWCSLGYHLSKVKFHVRASAENYHGGVVYSAEFEYEYRD